MGGEVLMIKFGGGSPVVFGGIFGGA